jgi:23S rRNA (cytidine1920-2'-O)/16S rRNA (cytidine1409-2'-O)-methyltransferase
MAGGLKVRLDQALLGRGLAASRARAQALIAAGLVIVDGQPARGPDQMVEQGSALEVLGRRRYVSRGGEKLAPAVETLGLRVTGRTAVDVGASTGGFTDVLLQGGAAHVIAVDVGYGQLDWRLRNDPRVTVLERVNIRELDKLPRPSDLAVVDVSFISLRLVLPRLSALLQPPADVVALVKPQFEVGKGRVGKGGVVRDPEQHREVLEQLAAFARSLGFEVKGQAPSPIAGRSGNREFFLWLGLG